MAKQRRVAVTSPQTRAALAARRPPTGTPPRLSAGETRLAERIRHRQLRLAAGVLVGAAALLLGLPLLLATVPVPGRLLDIPLGWLAVAALPYPVLALLAWWQLRRAEATERDAGPEGGP